MTVATTPAGTPRRRVPTVRLFATEATQPRARRIIDGITVVAALAALALLGWWAQPPRDFEQSLTEAAASAPDWLNQIWVLIYDFVLVLPVVVVLAALFRRRWAILVQCLVAGGVAAALVMTVARITGDASPSVDEALGIGVAVAWPAAAFTIAASLLLSVAADVTAPVRAFGMRALGIGAIVAVLAARTTVTGACAALLVAIAAAAVARLLVGTTGGHLSRAVILALLDALGVRVSQIERLTRQRDGLIVVEARGAGDERLLVKVYGRDAAESRLVSRLWRALAYRDGGAALAQAHSPGLAHETLVTLLATTRGVPVWEVETGGRPDGADEALVLRVDGERASDLPPGAFTDEGAAPTWEALGKLHAARIAHLGLGPTAIAVRRDGTIALTDMADATVAASEEALRTDEAQLLVCLAVLLGPDRAVASAHVALDRSRLAGLLPFLQTAALPRNLRAAARTAKLDIDALRVATASDAGVDPAELELAQLRRVTWGGLLRTGLLVLAAAVIIPLFASVDVDELRDALSGADWTLVIFAFVVAQLPRPAQAISTLGSVPVRLQFGPVYLLTLATSFLNLALPSAAARMALDVRFFQKQGVAPATAVTSGLIDSFVGNVIQVILLALMVLFTSLSLDLESDVSSDGGSHTLVVVIVLLVAAAIAAVLLIPRIRRVVLSRVRRWWPEVRAAVEPLRTSRKLAQLFGGNLAAELLFASALAIFVHAFGGGIGLVEALFVTTAASLLTVFIPIPGGIGVAEGALIVGLTSIGVDEAIAVSATICYRCATFYFPPLWGWFALRSLERNRFL